MATKPMARLMEAVTELSPSIAAALPDIHEMTLLEPNTVIDRLAPLMPGRFTITGNFESRVFVGESTAGEWHLSSLNGDPLGQREWPAWVREHIVIDDPSASRSAASITEEGVRRLFNPKVLLVTLYHPENFPLPRFPLAISDVARAARSTYSGRVRLMDMQLGTTLEDIKAAVDEWRPDIVGVSATFGQHDLMVELLDGLFAREQAPMVLAGGSLTARNEDLLLSSYPALLVARGAGEPTMADVISYFHKDIDIADIRGLGYFGAPRGSGMAIRGVKRRTATVANRAQTDIYPELDLLGSTFKNRGVAQLETSRGCTNYCSFCPRGHKGVWSGAVPTGLPPVLSAMGEVFDRYPQLSRTLYLVDEEFIGRGPDAAPRALEISQTLHDAGFRWESSCRVDQVFDPDHSREWHLERGAMWRGLLSTGLRRMLFGIESGVTSILERFNKETTGPQNALAIRTLSALGVPTRFTYITFDHLMSVEELAATRDFQARTDLILRPLKHLPVEEIIDGVSDPDFVAEHSVGVPFYTGISYMLVSMECLQGAAYTRKVEAAGLAGAVRPSMGRVDAEFLDWRIGIASHLSQMWVDRNFALDYMLKSLEKILDGEPYHAVREVRRVIKTAAFDVLDSFVATIQEQPPDEVEPERFEAKLTAHLDHKISVLAAELDVAVSGMRQLMTPDSDDLLSREVKRWHAQQGWRLINAAAPC